jgi:hypothetical protein
MANAKHPGFTRRESQLEAFERRMQRRMEKEQAAAEIVSRCFGIVHAQDTPAIDDVLASRLRAALGSIDEKLLEACWQRAILSESLVEALRLASFLSVTLPLARGAQSETGVPASLLIAQAFALKAGIADGLGLEWFLQQAAALKDAKARRAAIREYSETIAFLDTFGLKECDALRAIAY